MRLPRLELTEEQIWDTLAASDPVAFAEESLGLTPDRVRIVHGDTDHTPYGWGTFASRSLVISGGACHLAAQALAKRITAVAGQLLEAAATDIELRDGQARVKGTDKAIDIANIARIAYLQSNRIEGGPGLRETAT